VRRAVKATTATKVANLATQRMLVAGRHNGLLYGPRSSLFGKEQQPK